MSYQREETRWAKIEMEHRYNEEHNAELMASDKAKSNASSVAYNPLTLEYNDTYQGELLKYRDDQARTEISRREPFAPVFARCSRVFAGFKRVRAFVE